MSVTTPSTDEALESLSYDRDTETYRVEYDTGATAASAAVIAALAEILDKCPTSLEPLYGAVETDALDALVRERWATDDVSVTFVASGFEVTVGGGGYITLSRVGDVEDSAWGGDWDEPGTR